VAEIRVRAPAESCVEAAAGIKAELLAALGRAGKGDRLVLDLSEVRKSDSSLAQLAIAFGKEAEARGLEASLAGDSGERSIWGMLGCDISCAACAFKSLDASVRKSGEGAV
jgi:hypothetical protein